MLATPAVAQDATEFYKGKTVSILMGTGPGVSYDLYGRTIAEHISRHIPGQPTGSPYTCQGPGASLPEPHLRHRVAGRQKDSAVACHSSVGSCKS